MRVCILWQYVNGEWAIAGVVDEDALSGYYSRDIGPTYAGIRAAECQELGSVRDYATNAPIPPRAHEAGEVESA